MSGWSRSAGSGQGTWMHWNAILTGWSTLDERMQNTNQSERSHDAALSANSKKCEGNDEDQSDDRACR